MIEAVVFDWGGVLSTSPAEGLAALERRLGYPDGTFARLFAVTGADGTPLWRLLESGQRTMEQFVEEVTCRAPEVLGEQPVDLAAFSAFDWLWDSGIHWMVVHRIRDLRAEGYRTGLLTNNVAEWREAWRSTIPVDELFHDVVDSSAVGICKPDPAIYVLACERLGVPPERTVFLDDLERNVEAARSLGMQGVVVGADPTVAIAELDGLLAEDLAATPPNASP